MPEAHLSLRQPDISIERLLHSTRGDIGRAKQVGLYTGRWTSTDVDRVVARLRGEPWPPPPPQPVFQTTVGGGAPLPAPLALVPHDLPDDLPRVRLTPTQSQVLRRLCRGMTNRQIADNLHVSEDTVKTHLKSVLRALGVTDRTAAVVAVLSCAVVPTIGEDAADIGMADIATQIRERDPRTPTRREDRQRERLLAELSEAL